ncbi:MAG: site-specific DNA-methyltransferase [Burkholderiales bacterium]|nr:site-specific DNA-methyltransferase [Burkholderiales bacterium]
MQKIDATSPEAQSADIRAENIAKLRALFPEVFTEGKDGAAINVDVLKGLVGEVVADSDEKYGLNWHGKRRARQLALMPSTGTLRPCPDESVDWDTTQNLMIEGDNLEVLKLLQKSYAGKVKLIYIDPPYNTGKDFVYPDNFQDSIKNYLELTGQIEGGAKITSNTDASGRFHTDWLNMMYPRLSLARNLLKSEGVIFISIDDNEVADLRKVCDDIFGEENFVASLIWQKMDSPSRNEAGRAVTEYHDYILVYAKSRDAVRLKRKRKEEILAAYPLTLADGRLARRRQLRKNGKNARREDRPTLWFKLTAPDGTEVFPIAPEGWEGRWVLSPDTWAEREKAGLTEWIEREYGWVPYYIEIAPDEPMVPWPTLWTDVDQNRQAKARFTELMGGGVEFDNPKPPNLIRQMLLMSTEPGDLVLDFFAGSGTTGEAVVALNGQDGGNRRFVLVQLPESTSNAQLPTIAAICRERVRRVGKEMLQQMSQADDIESDAPDVGFRAFRLDRSNISRWAPSRDDLVKSIFDHLEHIDASRSDEDVLYELLLKLGLDLCVPIEHKSIAGKQVHSVGGGVLMACLDTSIAAADAEPLAQGIAAWRKELAPAGDCTCVFRDSAFADDVAKSNLAAILEQHGIAKVRSL